MGFKDYLGAFDEFIGDDELLGARAVRRGAPPIRAIAQRQLMTPMPGVPKAGPRLEPVGFPAFAFVVAGATTIAQTTRPQKPFKGSRLVIDIARTGATATGLITVVSLKIGARDVLINANPIGAGTFAANAFGVELMMDEATPGIDIVLTLATSAAPTAAGDRIDIAATIVGMTWS